MDGAAPTASAMGLAAETTLVSVYSREVQASLERIWENVLDWEHLPWLHRTSFTSVRLLAASPEGWRAVVGVPSRSAPREATIEIEVDPPRRRYLTRTLAGAGEGTEIATLLEPAGERATAIRVEFRVPVIDPLDAAAVGEGYRRLYARLWDEDQSMMVRRQEVLDRGPSRAVASAKDLAPVSLGPVSELRRRIPLTTTAYGQTLRIIEIAGRLLAHATVCPHRGGPLEEAFVEGSCVRCPWHGYRFDVSTGRGLDDVRLRLPSAPAVFVDPRTDEALLFFSGKA